MRIGIVHRREMFELLFVKCLYPQAGGQRWIFHCFKCGFWSKISFILEDYSEIQIFTK